jgi:WS/DGAT/MGAT family acyltransferase
MTDRLSATEVGFLYRETTRRAMHVGTVALFAPPAGDRFDIDGLVELIGRRIAAAPRYRQRVRFVPGRLANPVWVDDENFDLDYHVRHSALPRPGSDDQLRELVGRVQSRPLDRSRPLWELYIVEGLADGRFALVGKTHHALAGSGATDLATALLDPRPDATDAQADGWMPRPEPSALQLVAGAVAENLRRPSQVVETVRAEVTDVRATTSRLLGAVGNLTAAAVTTLRAAPATPLDVSPGEQRRFGMVATSLEDYRQVRDRHGGTVNDAVLATVAGALRVWLLTRGESVTPATVVRALAPVSVAGEGSERTDGDADGLRPLFVDLPVGEPSPVVRLHRVSYATRAHRESGQSVRADAISALSGFAPPRMHAAAARLGTRIARRLFNVIVTNVPGPQHPLFAGGARMTQCYPVAPLPAGHALTVGVTSYDGYVYFGLNADRDALPDVDVLGTCIEDALAELVEAST